MDRDEIEELKAENAQLRDEVARLYGSPSSVGPADALECQIVFDQFPILFFILDGGDRFQRFRSGRLRPAIPPEQFLGLRIADVFPPELAAPLSDGLSRCRATGERVPVEYEMPPLGHFVAEFVALADGRCAVFVNDVTERHRAEAALRESERRFRAFTEKATDILYVLDPDLKVRHWSPGATRALGWSAQEIEGRPGLTYVHPDDVPMMTVPKPEDTGLSSRHVYRVRHRDGSYHTLEASVCNLLGDPAVGGVVVNARDVTEQRRLEARSAESQKLESIGRLAGGVAHDFNNLLTVILSCGELQLEALAAGEPASADDTREILAAAERARELTQQLLAFARKQVIAPVVLDMNALVAESERLLRRLLGEDIALEIRLEPALGRVRADPAQLQQCVINLAVNARDAMPRGGHLEISTDNVDVDAARAAALQCLQPGPHVRLRVRDSGTGLSPEARAHLFEPFFTTRPRGQGTGLGLATVYGIVKQSGGSIAVESEEARGATFEILLPRSDGPLPQHERPVATRPLGRYETVLLVEDEPAVGNVAARVLREAGYRVVHAHHGGEALALARAESSIDLLVTDVVMPGLDGREVADELAKLHPEARTLFVSGYTQEAIVHRGVVDAGVEFLPKPFTPAALLARVREVLSFPVRR